MGSMKTQERPKDEVSWGGVLSSPDSQATGRIVNYCGSCVLCAEQGGSPSWHTVAKGGVLFEEGRCDVTSSWLFMSDSQGLQ